MSFLYRRARSLSFGRRARGAKRIGPIIAERVGDDGAADEMLLRAASQHEIAPREHAIGGEQRMPPQPRTHREDLLIPAREQTAAHSFDRLRIPIFDVR